MSNVAKDFLPNLAIATKQCSEQEELTVQDFADICEQILPIFDCLGPVLHFAKHEFTNKNESIREAKNKHATLQDLIYACEVNGSCHSKGSLARNLHRLVSAMRFVQFVLSNLMDDMKATLREAASKAYEDALAPIHTVMVRQVVRAGLVTLPTREGFLEHVGETEESARQHAMEFVKYVGPLTDRIFGYYQSPMPASTDWFISS